MAEAKVYLRPLGFLYGAAAEAAVASGSALPLAGGPAAFTLAELIEGVPGRSVRRTVTVAQLRQECTREEAIEHAADLAQAGAAIVDIGGESTRPGSDSVGEQDELARVMPVLEGP